MKCPVCRINMEDINIRSVCPRCDGMWLGRGMLKQYLAYSTRNRVAEIKDHSPGRLDTILVEGYCPKCNKLMDVHPLMSYGAKILHCGDCGGTFTGPRELAVMEYMYCWNEWPVIEQGLAAADYREQGFISEGSYGKGIASIMGLSIIDGNNPKKYLPWVTLTIIALNILIYILTTMDSAIVKALWFRPGDLTANPGQGLLTLFTSMFLHGGFFHVLGNMYFLWVFGGNVEDIAGSMVFFFLYLFFGIAAGFGYALMTDRPQTPVLGASGAVAGIMGAYLALYYRSRISIHKLFLFLPLKFTFPVWFYIGFNYFFMQIIYLLLGLPGVAWWAHIIGIVIGFITIFSLKKAKLI